MSNDIKNLADVQPGGRVRLEDVLPPLPKMQRFTNLYGETYSYSAEQMRDYARAALSAQPSPGGQGDALLESLVARWRNHAEEIGVSGNLLCQKIANCTMRHAAELQAVLAARQPVEMTEGTMRAAASRQTASAESNATAEALIAWARQPVGEPVEHACTNCDRKHAEVTCPACAGTAWDNGRLHEFHETRELCTSLGEGPLDHLLPEEWHEKPLLRLQGAYDEGDDSVGISPRSANVLADDQTGTVLGDYLAARAAKEGGQ